MPAVSEASIRQSCVELELELSPQQSGNILKIKDFLSFYGRAMNLTGAGDLDVHINEALHAVKLAQVLGRTGRWLDVGSGGGFPGLILAACLDLEFVFVEPRAKRASALELGLAKIGRGDVSVRRGRIDAGVWKGIEGATLEPGFDVASARAVFTPLQWIDEARHWLRPTGLICLHLRAGDSAPVGADVLGRIEGPRWAAVGVGVPRGT